MRLSTRIVLGIPLTAALLACSPQREQMAWPPPRPLGQDLPAFHPPERPEEREEGVLSFKEPGGALTLREAVGLALLNNPELKAFSWAVRAREAGALQAGLFPNPEMGMNIENMAGSGAFKGTDQAETTVHLSQVIELGGKRAARSRSAVLEQNLSSWDYEIKRLDVFTQVSKAFTTVLSAQERLVLMEEVLGIAQQVVETVSARVNAGKASPVEETKVKVALASIEIKLERAKRALTVSRKYLAATWGSRDPQFERVVGRLDPVSEIPSQETLTQALSQNPELARWVVEISNRQARISVEKRKAIPNLTLSGGLRHLNKTDDDVFVVGLSFPLPLLNRNQGGALEARHELAKAEEAQRAAAVWLNTTLSAAYNTLAAAQTELRALNENVLPGAQSAFEAVNEGYRLGKFSLIDVLDAQRTISDAKTHYLDVLTDYHLALADLERLIGASMSSEPADMEKKHADMD